MKKQDDPNAILSRMIELLYAEKFYDWADTLDGIRKSFYEDPKFNSSQLLSMYRGAGSINDIVFYRNGDMLVKENNEFDKLREDLFEVCRYLI